MTTLALPRIRARRRRWRPPGPDWWFALVFVALWALVTLYNLLAFMFDPAASWAFFVLASVCQLIRAWRLLVKYEGRYRAARNDPVNAMLTLGWICGWIAGFISAVVEVFVA